MIANRREASDYTYNYADEIPPKWTSTSKADYIPKKSHCTHEKSHKSNPIVHCDFIF